MKAEARERKREREREREREKMKIEIMGDSVLDTYVCHYNLALRSTLCSLTYLYTIQGLYL
jgi:hypothetical protein